MTDRYIRFSETKRFLECRRAWLNGYYLGLGKPEWDGESAPSTASTGNLVHADLDNHYYTGERIGAWLARQDVPGGAYGPDWVKTFTLARIMLEGYEDWLAEEGLDAGETTVGTELELTVPVGEILGDNVYLTVHIDRLIKDETWDRWVIDDFKTVAALTKGLEFDIDPQGHTYAWVVQQALGIRVDEFRHTMLRRVKRTAQANPPFYAREPFSINDEQMAATEMRLRGILRDMVEVYQQLDADPSVHRSVAYANPGKDCSWKCPFLPICKQHDDGTDLEGLRQALYVPRYQKDPSS